MTLKGLAAHKLRLALTALAVVLGVGFIAGTFVLTDTIAKTFDNIFADVTEGVDVYVRSQQSFQGQQGEDREPIPEALLTQVQEVPGVEVAAGSVSGFAQLVDRDGDAVTTSGAPTIGASVSPSSLGAATIRDGELPDGPGEVAVDAATAGKQEFEVGDEIQVLLQGPSETFALTGIIGFGEADNLGGATLALFELETAQKVFDKKGVFDSIEIAGSGEVSAGELRNRVAEVLPDGVEAATGASVADEQAAAIQNALGFFNTALLVFAGIALFVGAFIIFNTFSILIAQRTRELGLLRALGAGGGQVMVSVLTEAFLVGLVASAIGIGVGVLIALGLQALLSAFGLDLPSTSLQLALRTIVVSLVVGTVVTVMSSFAPARRAARISPMAALREAGPQVGGWSKRGIVAGALVTVAGVVALLYGLSADIGNEAAVVGAGAFLLFIGVAILSPLFAGQLARLVAAPLPRLFKVPGKLARENAARNPRRTASTASALMIGLALVSFVAIFAASLKASTTEILERTVRADFIVSTQTPGNFAGFSPRIADALAQQDGVAASVGVRQGEFRLDGASRFVTGVDVVGLSSVADLGVAEGELESLADGGLFLKDDTARDLGIDVGEELDMRFAASGDQSLTVEGLFEDTSVVTEFVIGKDTFLDHFSVNLDNLVLVRASDDASIGDVRASVEEVTAGFPNVSVADQAEFKEDQLAQIDGLLALVTALLGLALVIALLGITNTLALSVFERTRELGLLRAVGMTRRQVKSMIRWESVVISVIGALLGLVIGTFFGWALVRALSDDGITELAIPSGQLAAYVVVAAIAGVLAALPPARRAGRLNVLEAIATE